MIAPKASIAMMESATLRVWAAKMRDDTSNSTSIRERAKSLISILDAAEMLKSRNQILSCQLLNSANQIASMIVGD